MSVNQYIRKINSLIKKGDRQDAAQAIENALLQFPHSPALLKLAESFKQENKSLMPTVFLEQIAALYNHHQFDFVISKCVEYLDRYPDDHRLWNILAASNQNLGNFTEAEQCYLRVIEIAPDFVDAYNNLGTTYDNQARYDEAIVVFKKALAQRSDFAAAHNNLGNVYLKLQQTDDAINAYKLAVKHNPSYVQALSNLSNAYTEKGDVEKALEFSERAISLQPHSHSALNNFGMALLAKGQYYEAIEKFQSALDINPDYPEALNSIGSCYYRLNEIEKSIDAFSKALKIRPDYPSAHNNMGLALIVRGDLQSGLDAFDKALSLNPDYLKALYNKADCLFAAGQFEDSLALFDEYLERDSRQIDAYLRKGLIFQELLLNEKALEVFDIAQQLFPDNIKPSAMKSTFLQELGRDKEALEVLDHLVLSKGENRTLLGSQASLQAKLGEKDAAIVNYYKILDKSPEACSVYRVLAQLKTFENGDPLIDHMLSLYSKDHLENDQKSFLCNALAKVYEDLKDYQRSFKFLKEGNDLKSISLNYKTELDEILFDEIKKASKNLYAMTSKSSQPSIGVKRPIFILGMPRSGTTLTEQIISAHPNVFGAGELSYIAKFGMPVGRGKIKPTLATIEEVRHKYLNYATQGFTEETFFTDKMPHNFRYLGLIFTLFPDAKVIHLNRSAQAVCWSNYKQYFAGSLDYSWNLNDVVAFYKLYENMMEHWNEMYGDRIYQLNYQALTQNPEEETRKLIDYCGIGWDDACLSPHKNKRAIKTASQQQIRKKIYTGSSEEWRKYEPYLDGAFDLLK